MISVNTLPSKAISRPVPAGVDPGKGPARPLIVVAGRERESRFMLRSLLELWDYDVAEAATPQESLGIAESHRPTAVLIDGYLPMADCLAEVELIKQNECMTGVPLILLSGFTRERVGQGAKDSGADGMLVKPLDFDVLERLLKYFSEQSGIRF